MKGGQISAAQQFGHLNTARPRAAMQTRELCASRALLRWALTRWLVRCSYPYFRALAFTLAVQSRESTPAAQLEPRCHKNSMSPDARIRCASLLQL